MPIKVDTVKTNSVEVIDKQKGGHGFKQPIEYLRANKDVFFADRVLVDILTVEKGKPVTNQYVNSACNSYARAKWAVRVTLPDHMGERPTRDYTVIVSNGKTIEQLLKSPTFAKSPLE